MAFQVAAASVRGTSHRRSHTPCQDAAVVRRCAPSADANAQDLPPLVVGAVADGGGSRVLSHIGARLAANLATALMAARWDAAAFVSAAESDLDTFWRALFSDCRNAIEREAEQRSPPTGPAIDPGALACTLIAFMATPDRLSAAQVGDGFLVFGRPDTQVDGGVHYELMFQNRETEEAGQVVWITASNWAADLRQGVRSGPLDMVLASSDGIENVVLAANPQAPAQLLPHQRFFASLMALMRKAPDAPGTQVDMAEAERRLQKILSDPLFDEHVDDDKSAAMAFVDAGVGD